MSDRIQTTTDTAAMINKEMKGYSLDIVHIRL